MVSCLWSQCLELESYVHLHGFLKNSKKKIQEKGTIITLDCHYMEVCACLLIVLIKVMINLSWIKESHANNKPHIKG